MSFSKQYINILQEAEEKLEHLKNNPVTSFNGVDLNIELNTGNSISEFRRYEDYYDYESTCHIFENDEDVFEVYLSECAFNSDVDIFSSYSLNELFTDFIISIFRDLEIPSEFLKTIFNNNDISTHYKWLGTFYLSCIESIIYQSNLKYNDLKKQFPDEEFYPSFILNTRSLDYYESSKCW